MGVSARLFAIGVVALMIVGSAAAAAAPRSARASDGSGVVMRAQDDGGTTAGDAALAQASDGAEDTRVPVQVWTVMAAGGAMAVGLVLFLVRVLLGRAQPPPPPQEGEASGHH